MVIQILNLDKCLKKLSDLKNIDLTPALTEATRKVQRTAKDLAPVRSGRLRASISTKVDRKKQIGIVGTNVEYAPFLEFGTRKMKAQPFLNPALEINRKGIQQDVQKYIKDQLKAKANG
jgi:HK97 gp10 family phage protein